MKILAIIPARGGSKGIPGKNIVELNGKPLIAYTILEAQKIIEFGRILVSTDSEKIKIISEKFGVEVPFLRPSHLADDHSRTVDSVIDVLETLESCFNEQYDYVCLLQPTSPLRTAADIKSCLKLAYEADGESVVSLVRVEEPHPYKMKRIENGAVKPFIPGTHSSVPRQELPPAYELNGAVYIAQLEMLIRHKSFFSKNTIPYIMPAERSVNINHHQDLILAKALISKKLR